MDSVICVSIGTPDLRRARAIVRSVPFVELRLDLIRPQAEDMESLFATGSRSIATCRPGAYSEHERAKLLMRAIDLGAAFVDCEWNAPTSVRRAVMRHANKRGAKTILSHHDMKKTPGRKVLERIIDKGLGEGASIVKIACQVRTPRDCSVLLGLLSRPVIRHRLVIVGMGPLGRSVRVMAPLMGSPFTFAAPAGKTATASGQYTSGALRKIWRSMGVREET